MKINLVSDLHLEFCPLLDLPGGEMLLLAGDITTADTLRPERTDRQAEIIRARATEFFTKQCGKYKQVYYIPGNHEHYHGTYEKTVDILRKALEGTNVQVLDNEVVELRPGLTLFGGTMWTNYANANPIAMETAKNAMNDHHVIAHDFKVNGRQAKFLPESALDEHRITVRKLKAALENRPDDDFVVMTHHCPTYQSIHPKYGTDMLNYAFSSDLSDIILDNPRIKFWVHGHTHDTFKYAVGTCQVLCNPRGYTYNQKSTPENKFWDPNFAFEV